jgi:hypothetical protein
MVNALQTLKGLIIEKAQWTGLAAAYLARIDHDCPVEFYKHEVLTGVATLLHVKTPDGKVVAAVVVRIDDTAEGQELVIVAAGGECAGRLMTLDVLPTFEACAKSLGCVSVRAHTRRSAVVAGFLRAGYVVDEYILRKTVA